jgi:hypothetical protein
MNPPVLVFAAAALIPAMTAPADGTPRTIGTATFAVALCDGGSLVLSLVSGAPQPATPCSCAKGCREARRRWIDRKQ